MTNTPDFSISCSANFGSNTEMPLDRPITLSYMIYEDLGGGGGGGGDGEEGATESENTVDYGTDHVPIAGIGFEPWVLGGVDADKTNSEFKVDADTVSPAKFAGIVTPRSEWCSDACGRMQFDVWPVCIQGKTNSMKGGISVQGIVPTADYAISIENEDEDE